MTQPPLRERIGDIPLLVDHYIHEINEQTGKHVAAFDQAGDAADAATLRLANVRELVNVVERAIVLAKGRSSEQRICRRALRGRPAGGPLQRRPGRSVEPQDGSGESGAADHCRRTGGERLEPPGDGPDAGDQPDDAVQEDEEVRHRV